MNEIYIRDIERKLCNNERLDGLEIRTIIAALRESSHCYQEPYYEVIYHDEYGKTESRIMNPEHRGYRKDPLSDDLFITEDKFSINFRRLVRKEDL